jgi:hypothetical protein
VICYTTGAVETSHEDPRPSTLDESRAVFHAEGEGLPFLLYRAADGEQRLFAIRAGQKELTIGRNETVDVSLGWDPEVSGLHARLELTAGEVVLVDDGLSRNGSFVNGERVLGRRRLRDGDALRVGGISLVFRAPAPGAESTVAADPAALVRLTEAERRVLVALCRPMTSPGGPAVPSTNAEIAGALHLSLDGVKSHLRALFAKLGIEEMPQYRKRTELARRALDLGLVTPRDLQG